MILYLYGIVNHYYKERILSKRLILEIIHIKRQKNNLNLQSDTECLDDGIITILNKLK